MEKDILYLIEKEEKKSKKRIWLFSLVPIVLTIILVLVSYFTVTNSIEDVANAQEAVNIAEQEIIELRNSNDSLVNLILESTESLGRVISVAWEFKEFIDGIPSAQRTAQEASYYIRFRMLEERIRGDYNYISKSVIELPDISNNKTWIVIVKSNVSLEDLSDTYEDLIEIYGKNQIAIYRDANDIYALSVKGNGTFTRAYRLNVELRDTHNYYGCYFRGLSNWGKDYSFISTNEYLYLPIF